MKSQCTVRIQRLRLASAAFSCRMQSLTCSPQLSKTPPIACYPCGWQPAHGSVNLVIRHLIIKVPKTTRSLRGEFETTCRGEIETTFRGEIETKYVGEWATVVSICSGD